MESLSSIVFLVFCLGVWGISLHKKKSQLGKTWDGPLTAIVVIKEKELQCSHCSHNQFSKVEGLLTTTWVTLFRFPFWNKSASCFVCKNCGFVHWFLQPKEKADVKRVGYDGP